MLPRTSWLPSLGGSKLLSFVPWVVIGMCEGPAIGWFISESVAWWLEGCQWPSTSSLRRVAGGCIEDSTSGGGGMFSFGVVVLVGCARFCPRVRLYNPANFGSVLRAGLLLRCAWMHSHRSPLFRAFSRETPSAWASSRRSALLLLESAPLNATVGPRATFDLTMHARCFAGAVKNLLQHGGISKWCNIL